MAAHASNSFAHAGALRRPMRGLIGPTHPGDRRVTAHAVPAHPMHELTLMLRALYTHRSMQGGS